MLFEVSLLLEKQIYETFIRAAWPRPWLSEVCLVALSAEGWCAVEITTAQDMSAEELAARLKTLPHVRCVLLVRDASICARCGATLPTGNPDSYCDGCYPYDEATDVYKREAVMGRENVRIVGRNIS